MTERVFSIEQVKEMLPQRYPMLMVDRLWTDGRLWQGLKCITANEATFLGHFPHFPIMPGVLQLELMAQVATVAVQPVLDPGRAMDIYLKVLSNVKFRKPATPGDRLLSTVEAVASKDGSVTLKAKNESKAGVTCQAELEMAVRPRRPETRKPSLFNDTDKGESILMDVNAIRSFIPHRFPFLFVDYILSIDGDNVVAAKNCTHNEPLMYAYPDYHVLSGPIQAEIVAQAGCVHTLARPENKGKTPFYMGIHRSEFLRPIHPGDQLRIEVVLPKGGSKFGKGVGRILVDGEVASTTEMTFALMDADIGGAKPAAAP